MVVLGLVSRIRQSAWVCFSVSSFACCENLDKLIVFLCLSLLTCNERIIIHTSHGRCENEKYQYMKSAETGVWHIATATKMLSIVITKILKQQLRAEEMEMLPRTRHTVTWWELNRDFLTEESIHMLNIEFLFPTRGHSLPSESSNS